MTKPIVITIPHELGKTEARRRIDEGFGRLEKHFAGGLAHVHKSWSDDLLRFTARVMGQGISGRLEVMDHTVRIEVDLPKLLAAIAGRLTGQLKREGRLLLEKK